jgi:two-component system cell cycle sensor histidine kinase/response regulator CckA
MDTRRDIDLRSHLPFAHFLIDKSGLIHEADQTGALQLGSEIPSLLKSSFLSRVVWDDRDIFTSFLKQVFDKKEILSCEVRLVKSNGSVFHSYIKNTALKDPNDDDNLCRLTVRDISFIRLLEKLISKEKNYADSLIRSSIDGVVALDTIHQILEWSPAMERMTGIPRKDCIGKNVFTVFPFLKKIGEDRYINAALKGRKVTSRNRHYYAAKTGRQGSFDAHYSPVRDESGDVSGTIAVIKDITEIKNQEKEFLKAKELETIGSLASGFAHDYNDLLTGILGNISLAKLYLAPGDKSFELIDRASKIVLRARDLTRQLTMLASGDLAKKPVLIGPILRDLLNLTMGGSDIVSKCDIDDALWPVEIDEGQFWQAIHTIIRHIRDTSDKGSSIHLSADNAVISRNSSLPLLEGKYILISVSHLGPAIKDEKVSSRKDPFSISTTAADGVESRAAIAIAYDVINNHQGLITVEPAPEPGITYSIFLPATEKSVNKASRKIELPVSGKGNILIMDDDEDVRDIAGKILNHMGYETAFAQDGEEAIRAYMDAMNAGNPFNIVILDLNIQGGMGGKDAMASLLDMDQRCRSQTVQNRRTGRNHLKPDKVIAAAVIILHGLCSRLL